MAGQSITNKGDRTVAVPLDDGTSYPLEPGASADFRIGVAEFAVRTFGGVEYADEVTLPLRHGIAEASTGAAVDPIAAYVEANPDDIRYAVVNDTPTIEGAVTVVGSDELAVQGGQTTAAVGTAAVVTPTEDAPAKPTARPRATAPTGDNA